MLNGSAFGSRSRSQDGPSAAPAPAKIVFTKEFPKSVPEYFAITLSQTGEAIYATAPDDSQPVTFRLSEELTKRFFEAAGRLNNFRGAELERKNTGTQRVAFMGKKTLAYESGSTRHQASFNYTDDADGRALADAFEKIGASERYFLDLERIIRFDRLGTYEIVLQIEKAMEARELIEPAQFLPLLEKIVKDSHFMHVAQEHAAAIIARVNSGKYTPNLELNAPRQ